MGAVDEVTTRVFEALERDQRRRRVLTGPTCSATAASRSRRLPRSTTMRGRRRWSSGETLELLRALDASPAMTTGELDRIAAENIRGAGALPSFLGYGHPPFPATICISVNDEVVHGIPGDRVVARRRHRLHRLRRDRRRLARRRRPDHRRRRAARRRRSS